MRLNWMMLTLFVLLLFLGACGEDSTPISEMPEEEGEPLEEESGKEEKKPYRFFMEDGTIAHFKGEGNEFAQFTVRTVYLADDHIATYEDNGGTTVLKVYRLSDDAADLVLEQGDYYEEYEPSLEELQDLEPIARYFELPIEVGDKMDGKEVVQTDALAETPYENFENAFLAENIEEEGAIVRSYFVEGFGEVKQEFIMVDEAEEFRVTSSLETIE